jgi:3-methyladenine DNA glycosylase/8-oxoguanine DNA glycosylase
MVFLLRDEGVDTEGDLRAWLQDDRSMRLLRALKGIGPKTIDYLKMLAGLPAIPVDRHVRLFAQCAGVTCTDYADLRTVLERASDFLGVACSSLDYAIWSYVSAGNSLSPPAAA